MTPWTTAHHAPLSSIISQSLLKFMFIKLVMLSNCLIFCHPLILLLSIVFIVRVFSIDSALCIRWPKYCSFSFNSSPSNEYSGLISFRIDWFHLLAVQGTLESLLQHHNSKALMWCSSFCKFRLSSKWKALPDDRTRKRCGSEHLGWQLAPRSKERQSGNTS